jgi:hypothetical protein
VTQAHQATNFAETLFVVDLTHADNDIGVVGSA